MKKFQSKSIAKLQLSKTTVSNLTNGSLAGLIGGGGTNAAANGAGTSSPVNTCGSSTVSSCYISKVTC
jgi:hypothetical protein